MVNLTPWKRRKSRPAPSGRLADAFDRFFDEPFVPMFNPFSRSQWLPRVDVSDGRKHITVEAEIPGMDKKDIDLSIEGQYLHIKGQKKKENQENREGYYRVERSYGFFNRVVELPAPVDETSVDARYRRGVLKIKLKKTGENNGRSISIAGDN